jgi:hypothetical protein
MQAFFCLSFSQVCRKVFVVCNWSVHTVDHARGPETHAQAHCPLCAIAACIGLGFGSGAAMGAGLGNGDPGRTLALSRHTLLLRVQSGRGSRIMRGMDLPRNGRREGAASRRVVGSLLGASGASTVGGERGVAAGVLRGRSSYIRAPGVLPEPFRPSRIAVPKTPDLDLRSGVVAGGGRYASPNVSGP